MNDYINLTIENIDKEHLCCAIGDKKHECGVLAKKEWLKNRIQEGHIFRKLNAKGKIFIEYAPLEKAWTPIEGENYLYIYCLWVAGSFKGKGFGKELLDYCIEDAKRLGKNGICVISSKKKKPFLSEKPFFEKYGFKVCDSVEDYELLALSFNEVMPKFINSAKQFKVLDDALTIYYSPECPYTLNCIKEIQEYMSEISQKVNFIKIDSLEKAKTVPCIFNNWATFYKGKFVSNTLLNANSLKKLLEK